MSNAIATRTDELQPDQCGCYFYLDRETHDRIYGIEGLSALDAVRLASELAMGETHEFEPHDFARFVAQHDGWNDRAAVARLADPLDDLSAGYSR